jgi:hypothetical protein
VDEQKKWNDLVRKAEEAIQEWETVSAQVRGLGSDVELLVSFEELARVGAPSSNLFPFPCFGAVRA